MRVRLIRKFDFQAAHRLMCFPEGHKCRRLHGHGFEAELVLEGEVHPEVGYLVDFGEVKAKLKPIRDQLDHAYLNDLPDLTHPTAEMLSKWIYDRLKPELPALKMVRLSETCSNAVEYEGD
jgi:6-pyruvoyltetrahydropterin/6-carboxytetrahydropterin synthase